MINPDEYSASLMRKIIRFWETHQQHLDDKGQFEEEYQDQITDELQVFPIMLSKL